MAVADRPATKAAARSGLFFAALPRGNSRAHTLKLRQLRGVHIADVPTDSFREIIATGNTPVVYSDELIPRMSALFSMEISSSSELRVVACVIPSLLFEEVSLLKTPGLSPPYPFKNVRRSNATGRGYPSSVDDEKTC